VLRASVVFLHATLEEFLRSIFEEFMPWASEERLNLIPIAGGNKQQPEKFFLGRLAKYRIDSVMDILKESGAEQSR
jgi:hypothetical protein